ncbi:uncharacterized protein [Chironomus tepperi]|uniref:uncharacterized protein isoform X2 n=1 Tax=Chironomus tepperi TaxID=113505 RepID=UPI00391F4A7B
MHRIVVLIYIIASILSVASQNNYDNHQHMQSKDIHVEAFAATRILQFNITLMKRIQKAYEIEITSILQDDEDDKFCPPIIHCLSHVSPNTMSTVIPENSFYRTDRDDCIFHNDCYYNISIRSYDRSFDESITFHSKECVNGLCACKHSSKLPTPKINSTAIDLSQLYFKWEIDDDELMKLPNNTFLQFLTIEVHELKKCNISWTYKSSLASFHDDLNQYGLLKTHGDYRRHLNSNMTSECLRIRMNVIDGKNCIGPKFEKMIKIPKREYKTVDKTFTVQFVLVTVISVFILCGMIILSAYGYVWWNRKKNIINYWRGIYNNNPQHGSSGSQMIPMRENPLYMNRDSTDDDFYEIPPSSIKEIGREIGKGAFGRVYIARISEIPGKVSPQIVAIKKLKRHPTSEQLEEFLAEISTMKKVGKHPNIVRLLGSCMVDQSLMMVMEYVPCGDLLRYLRAVRAKHESSLKHNQLESQLSSNINNNNNSNSNSIRHSMSSQTILGPLGKYLDILHSHSTSASETSSYITQPDSLPSGVLIANGSSRPSYAETMFTNLTVPSNPELTPMIPSLEYVVDHTELHNFAMQIALGMKHLEEKRITHRDLAARNILIDENKNLKISDFGLSRWGIYVNTKNKKVPLRWLSIEAMKDNLYSSKSDVWSFAIVLWEIGTLGGFPYPTIQNHELLSFLKSGKRLEKPENCSDVLYELMLQCWTTDPDDRPNFSDICKKLDPNKNRIYIDFSELSPNYVFPPTSDGVHNNEKNNKKTCDKLSKA